MVPALVVPTLAVVLSDVLGALVVCWDIVVSSVEVTTVDGTTPALVTLDVVLTKLVLW